MYSSIVAISVAMQHQLSSNKWNSWVLWYVWSGRRYSDWPAGPALVADGVRQVLRLERGDRLVAVVLDAGARAPAAAPSVTAVLMRSRVSRHSSALCTNCTYHVTGHLNPRLCRRGDWQAAAQVVKAHCRVPTSPRGKLRHAIPEFSNKNIDKIRAGQIKLHIYNTAHSQSGGRRSLVSKERRKSYNF